jgi:hypothetical protein
MLGCTCSFYDISVLQSILLGCTVCQVMKIVNTCGS